jgi:NAD(P)-dependent dehydrogenase (short-subunit alcohol dehydrogenase family)
MIGILDDKVAIVTVVSRGISREAATLFSAEGAMIVWATGSLHEGDHKPFDDLLTTMVSEDLKCNLTSSWRNIYG